MAVQRGDAALPLVARRHAVEPLLQLLLLLGGRQPVAAVAAGLAGGHRLLAGGALRAGGRRRAALLARRRPVRLLLRARGGQEGLQSGRGVGGRPAGERACGQEGEPQALRRAQRPYCPASSSAAVPPTARPRHPPWARAGRGA